MSGSGVVMRKRQDESTGRWAMVQQLLLSIPEVAASLRLSRAKVYRLIYYEGLPVLRFGRSVRVSVVALQEWIERRKKSA